MAKKTNIISNWYRLISDLQYSPKTFYSTLEDIIKEQQLPNVEITRIDYREGSVFSAQREYLRIMRKEYCFDICGAPFGKNFFVSWWLFKDVDPLLSDVCGIPVLGMIFRNLFRPVTYYRLDTAYIFQEAIHGTILKVLEKIIVEQGLRSLSEDERKPILKEWLSR